jgi:hypothetical protein
MASDSSYYVAPHDWPAVGHKGDLTADEVEGVLDDFEEFYAAALRGLGRTLPLASGPSGPVAGETGSPSGSRPNTH